MRPLAMTSPINSFPEVTKDFTFSKNLTLCDCTLRDGEQQAGVVFTKDDKVEIARILNEMHIPEIEAGMPCNSEEDAQAIAEISKIADYSRITCCIRGMEQDFDLAKRIGAWGVTISLPVGDLQRQYKLKWDDDTYIANMKRLTEYGKNLGLYVTLSPYDTTRANLDFLDRLMREIVSCGTVDRVRLVDTVGSSIPETVAYVTRRMKSILGEKIWMEVHCHNDFGLGVASTIAGACAGAEVVSTTINGLGERSGNTSTEEVALALKLLYGKDLGIDMTRFCEISRIVEAKSGSAVGTTKAVVGPRSFSHEAGMVVAGVLQEPFVAEAYDPSLVGQTRHIIIGKKSGAKSIEAKLLEKNISPATVDIKGLLNAVKEESITLKRGLEDNEFFALVGNYRIC